MTTPGAGAETIEWGVRPETVEEFEALREMGEPELSEEDALLAGQVVEDALKMEEREMSRVRDRILDAVPDGDLKREFLALPAAERDGWLAAKMEEEVNAEDHK